MRRALRGRCDLKPVDQTTFGNPGGNCFSACVASILELAIDDVPYFMGDVDWIASFAHFLRPYGMYPITARIVPGDEWRPRGFYILGGESLRGPHAVVARGAELVHDPHPLRTGLVKIDDATLLVPFDPGVLLGALLVAERVSRSFSFEGGR